MIGSNTAWPMSFKTLAAELAMVYEEREREKKKSVVFRQTINDRIR